MYKNSHHCHPSLPVLLKIYLHLNSVPRRQDFCAFGEKTGERQTPRSGAVVPDRNYHRCRARFAHGRTGHPHNLRTLHTLHNCTSAAHLGSPGLTAKCGECAALVTSRGPLKVPPRPPPSSLLLLASPRAPNGSCNNCVSTHLARLGLIYSYGEIKITDARMFHLQVCGWIRMGPLGYVGRSADAGAHPPQNNPPGTPRRLFCSPKGTPWGLFCSQTSFQTR